MVTIMKAIFICLRNQVKAHTNGQKMEKLIIWVSSVSVLQSVDLDGEIRAIRREEIHPGAVSIPAVFVYLRVHC